MINEKYGVVYTPESLSCFVAELLKRSAKDGTIKVILDPASGECALLSAANSLFGDSCNYIGIDIDIDAISATKTKYKIIHDDAILPQEAEVKSVDYWCKELPEIDAIIANPPWSSEKKYKIDELRAAGFSLVSGQYDSYVLFIELAYGILRRGGLMAFIIPDSLFDAQNTNLRKYLIERTQIKVIARLGEKIFEEVNRATTIIVCQKEAPNADSETFCFRLSTDDRKAFLSGKDRLISLFDQKCHRVKQSRFHNNSGYTFDIDTRSNEEALLNKIRYDTSDLHHIFDFGRGVEISKTGKVVYCPNCHYAQGFKKKQFEAGVKTCTNCGKAINISYETVQSVITQKQNKNSSIIYVGENVRRYGISGENYIRDGIEGINYKNKDLYKSPKLLVRKTGLGIYCAIDYSGNMTSQTVYILKYLNSNNSTPLEYYLALLNSRVVYYYYLKTFGENEWKSHPYLTKQIIFSLPVRPYIGSQTDKKIIELSKKIMRCYDHNMDTELEKLIMRKYNLTEHERKMIIGEMNKLPDLSAVNNMKMEAK